jgi:TolA-binding protein
LGSFRKSIDYFRKAVAGDPQPEFHYWLAETYLGRGDFIRALYHYQAIVNKFPKDEMWEPTAEFKSGLALEFLDATVEAKKLYEGIIKRRGKEDVWGKEAVKRLELLK